MSEAKTSKTAVSGRGSERSNKLREEEEEEEEKREDEKTVKMAKRSNGFEAIFVAERALEKERDVREMVRGGFGFTWQTER